MDRIPITRQPSSLPPGGIQSLPMLPIGRDLSARLGQILQGQITGEQGNQVTIQIGKQQVQADAEVPLNIGDKVTLQFKGIDDGKASLKLLTHTVSSGLTPMTTQDLSQQLTQMRLPPTPENIDLAKKFIEYGLPMSISNFEDVKKTINKLANAQDSDAIAAIMLKSKGLPLNSKNVANMSKQLFEKPNLGEQLAQAQRELSRMPKGDNLKGLLPTLSGLVGNLMPDLNKSQRKKLEDQLKELAGELGVDESDLKKAQLGELVLGIRNNLGGNMSGGNQDQRQEQLARLLEELKENIDTQRMINQKTSENGTDYWCFQLPFTMNHEVCTAKIIINSENSGTGVLDPDNIRINFSVETRHLGLVDVDLHIRNKIVNCQIATETEDVRSFVEEMSYLLKENFGELSFPISELKCVNENTAEEENGNGVSSTAFKKEDFENVSRLNIKL